MTSLRSLISKRPSLSEFCEVPKHPRLVLDSSKIKKFETFYDKRFFKLNKERNHIDKMAVSTEENEPSTPDLFLPELLQPWVGPRDDHF